MIYSYKDKKPLIAEGVFVAPTAMIIGEVVIESGASIWFNAVLRGDNEPIKIGRNTNIQDNCTIHTDEGFPVTIGSGVSVGHNAVLHGCTVADDCLVGINSTVLNGADIKSGSIVAAGAVVRAGQSVGPDHLVAGIPATLKKELTEADRAAITTPVANYLKHAREYQSAIEHLQSSI